MRSGIPPTSFQNVSRTHCCRTLIAADVVNVDAARDEDACDEKAAVAVGGVFFGAEEGDAELLHSGFEAGDAFEEEVGFGDAVIEYVTFGVVVLVAFGAAAEFAA